MAFTVQDAARITGATERNIRFWCAKADVVIPEIANPHVQRSPKLFSVENLFQIAAVDILTDRGIKLPVLREMLQGRKLDWWQPTLARTEILILRGGKHWFYFMVPVPPQAGALPDLLVEELAKALTEAVDVVALNLSTVKAKVLAG